MNRTRYLRTFRIILSSVYILCFLSRTSYAGSVIKENGDLDIKQVEDNLNSLGSELPEETEGYIKSRDSESKTKNDDESAQLADKRASFNAWGGKRSDQIIAEDAKRPKFAAWGGKRDDNWEQRYEDFKRAGLSYLAAKAKKPSFSSWGGKRSDGQYKRPFNAWGGKRADELVDYEENGEKRAFNAWGGKRSGDEKRKFMAWGGKRTHNDLDDDLEAKYKRPQFSSWGGKRSDNELSDEELQKRPQFSSWGGKRSEPDRFDEKRARFNSWGGKRAHLEDSDLDEMKRKFSSWGGKRESLQTSTDLQDPKRDPSSPSAKNGIDFDLDKETPQHSIQRRSVRYPEVPEWKRKFNPWAGKRSIRPSNEEWLEQIKRNFNPWGGKRASFSAWGGKRARQAEDDDDDRKELLLYTLKRQSFRPWGGK